MIIKGKFDKREEGEAEKAFIDLRKEGRTRSETRVVKKNIENVKKLFLVVFTWTKNYRY